MQEAHKAGLTIRVKEHPTERRCSIARILLHAVEQDWKFDELRGILAGILDIPTADVEVLPFGAAIGLLTNQQANTMAKLVEMGESIETKEKASN